MKPAAFDYLAPSSLAEAIALLQEHGDGAKLISGGQSLMPMLNMRLARPKVLIDLGGLDELRYIREEPGSLVIGALTRQREVERSPLVQARLPLLHEAIGHVAHPQIRNRGTIGGSLAHADPASELACLSVCLDAELTATGPEGERVIPASEFFLTYYTTTLMEGEVLTQVRFPLPPARCGAAFVELSRRHGDFALVGVACVLVLDTAGAIAEARVTLTGVGGTPVRASATEAALVGARPEPAALAAAAAQANAGLDPDSDIHASAEYRRHLAVVMTERALGVAAARAKGGGAA